MQGSAEVLEKLRDLMRGFKPQSLFAYIIPTEDAHQNEYICKHDARRAFISGFNGSAGTAVVTYDKAIMWTDGRYYQQAEKQMNSSWELMKDGLPNTPSIGKWLTGNIPRHSNVGVDPTLFSYRQWKPLQKQLKSAGFLNLRGSDIDFNPVFFAYLIIDMDKIKLFIDESKLPEHFGNYQKENNIDIKILQYDFIEDELQTTINSLKKGKIWISPTSNYHLCSLIPKILRFQEITPIALNKAIKNVTEINGFVDCHVRDGISLCRYFAWLEQTIQSGEEVSEVSGAAKLEEIRSKSKYYMGLSFSTISASGPNGSIIHYNPDANTNRHITSREIYLCDSGAQYLDGTTDVTRTFHFGVPTEFQKDAYTRVLKGQLAFGSTIFPAMVKGQFLDTIARKFLWDVGLDYGHGTGHGIGSFLNVHEGPMGVGIRSMPDDPGLQENMFISNEPGYYQDGEFGIRIEDIVQIVPALTKHNFAGRGALTFKTITMCPKQTKMVNKNLLSDVELNILNDYHKRVWEILSPVLREEGDYFTLAWLEKETRSI
ncbi:xaa-Pro aminopeptidase ApepP isoform X2 [Eurosta solidaginis]|uniref:xaa-Pro aminopeptidase ApepP isoform X2 n=1 Tax=Eurosta solidaginis TaxID=178769 RepID=UPI00353057C2